MPAALDQALNGRPRFDSDVPARLCPHCVVMVSVSSTTLSTTDSVQRHEVRRGVCLHGIHNPLIVSSAQTPRPAMIFRLGSGGATELLQGLCRMFSVYGNGEGEAAGDASGVGEA